MKWKCIIGIILIFIFADILFASNRQITWDPVAGAAGYYLEIKDSQGMIVVDTTVKENFFAVSKLNPGSYSFRVATINILNQKGENTPWIDFVIEKLFIPVLKSVSQRQLLSSILNKNIVVRGENFKSGGKLLLRRKDKEIVLTDTQINSDNEAVFSYKPDKSSKGNYDLVIVNRGEAESVLKDAIEIVEAEAAETICYIGAAYLINISVGKWSYYYPLSYTGADIYFQFSGRNIGFENILFDVELEAVRYNNADSLRKSTFSYAAFGIGSGYYYPVLVNSIELFMKIQGGGVYTSITLDEDFSDNSVSSIDIFAMAAAGVRAYLSESFFIDSTFGLKSVFYTGAVLHDIRISLGCGTKF